MKTESELWSDAQIDSLYVQYEFPDAIRRHMNGDFPIFEDSADRPDAVVAVGLFAAVAVLLIYLFKKEKTA